MNLTPATVEFDLGPKVGISGDGEVSVPHHIFPKSDSVILSESEFISCPESIEKRLYSNPIDVKKMAQHMAKT